MHIYVCVYKHTHTYIMVKLKVQERENSKYYILSLQIHFYCIICNI